MVEGVAMPMPTPDRARAMKMTTSDGLHPELGEDHHRGGQDRAPITVDMRSPITTAGIRPRGR